jgi:hypothetical protein
MTPAEFLKAYPGAEELFGLVDAVADVVEMHRRKEGDIVAALDALGASYDALHEPPKPKRPVSAYPPGSVHPGSRHG